MNLYQKIIEVRKSIGGLGKDKTGFGYDYVSGNQILAKIKDKMDEMGLILSPSCQMGSHDKFAYKNSKGEEKYDIQVWGDMTYTWINADNPEETLDVKWLFFGQQDDISKAYGSALTYSERYYLLKFFGLPTDSDDPDSKDTRGKRQATKDFTMPFGKHKGKKLSEIDEEYLQWLANDTQDADLRSRITEYLITNGTVNTSFQKTMKGLEK